MGEQKAISPEEAAKEILRAFANPKNWKVVKPDDNKPHIVSWIGCSCRPWQIASDAMEYLGFGQFKELCPDCGDAGDCPKCYGKTKSYTE